MSEKLRENKTNNIPGANLFIETLPLQYNYQDMPVIRKDKGNFPTARDLKHGTALQINKVEKNPYGKYKVDILYSPKEGVIEVIQYDIYADFDKKNNPILYFRSTPTNAVIVAAQLEALNIVQPSIPLPAFDQVKLTAMMQKYGKMGKELNNYYEEEKTKFMDFYGKNDRLPETLMVK